MCVCGWAYVQTAKRNANTRLQMDDFSFLSSVCVSRCCGCRYCRITRHIHFLDRDVRTEINNFSHHRSYRMLVAWAVTRLAHAGCGCGWIVSVVLRNIYLFTFHGPRLSWWYFCLVISITTVDIVVVACLGKRLTSPSRGINDRVSESSKTNGRYFLTHHFFLLHILVFFFFSFLFIRCADSGPFIAIIFFSAMTVIPARYFIIYRYILYALYMWCERRRQKKCILCLVWYRWHVEMWCDMYVCPSPHIA